MARKRVEDTVPALESWDDVNQALATIADNQRTVENFEAAMQNKIDEAKAEAEARSRVFIEATKRLERQIKEFAEAHRDDMDGKKTKTLNFGAVGFRKSTKIKLPKAPTKLAEIIQLLRSKGMDDCVKTPAPSVDKDALRKYPTQDIVAVGASIEVDAGQRPDAAADALHLRAGARRRDQQRRSSRRRLRDDGQGQHEAADDGRRQAGD